MEDAEMGMEWKWGKIKMLKMVPNGLLCACLVVLGASADACASRPMALLIRCNVHFSSTRGCSFPFPAGSSTRL